jgi:hypothetical protein
MRLNIPDLAKKASKTLPTFDGKSKTIIKEELREREIKATGEPESIWTSESDLDEDVDRIIKFRDKYHGMVASEIEDELNKKMKDYNTEYEVSDLDSLMFRLNIYDEDDDPEEETSEEKAESPNQDKDSVI